MGDPLALVFRVEESRTPSTGSSTDEHRHGSWDLLSLGWDPLKMLHRLKPLTSQVAQ